jgi:hypothetical protein
MKTKVFSLTVLITCSLGHVVAQQAQREMYLGNGVFSIDVAPDPQSIAMAESFVALQSNSSAMLYNPAGLTWANRVSISYSHRDMNWITGVGGMKYQAITGSVPTDFLNIGLLYNRFTQGELLITTEQNPDGDGTTVSVYDHTFGIGLSKQYDDHLGFGLSVKTFNSILNYKGPGSQNPTSSIETTALPLLFDFGILYSNNLGTEQESHQQRLNIGLSVQNVGTVLKQKQTVRNLTTNSISSQEHAVTLPRYLRLGLSYQFAYYGETHEALAPLNMLVTSEYRNALNGIGSRRDYWGFGLELKLFEIASVRVGSLINPYSSIYGNEGTPTLRYGFGLSAPFHKIDGAIPLTLKVDYAAIPLNDVGSLLGKVKVLHAFSVGLQYENELF